MSVAHPDPATSVFDLLRKRSSYVSYVVISCDYRAPLQPGSLNPPMRVE
jgi:hypothetical protein